jgi:hypothetical protein
VHWLVAGRPEEADLGQARERAWVTRDMHVGPFRSIYRARILPVECPRMSVRLGQVAGNALKLTLQYVRTTLDIVGFVEEAPNLSPVLMESSICA